MRRRWLVLVAAAVVVLIGVAWLTAEWPAGSGGGKVEVDVGVSGCVPDESGRVGDVADGECAFLFWAGIRVRLTQADGEVRDERTDQAGKAAFRDVAPGLTTVTATSPMLSKALTAQMMIAEGGGASISLRDPTPFKLVPVR